LLVSFAVAGLGGATTVNSVREWYPPTADKSDHRQTGLDVAELGVGRRHIGGGKASLAADFS
jgi:hypothetical protein